MAHQQQISLTRKQRIKTRSWAKFCQFEPSDDTGECSTRTQIRKGHRNFYGKGDSGTCNMTALLYLDKHIQVHLPSLLCYMSLTVQSREENTPQTRQWHYTNRNKRKRKARLGVQHHHHRACQSKGRSKHWVSTEKSLREISVIKGFLLPCGISLDPHYPPN